VLAFLCLVLITAAVTGGFWARIQLRASLPILDGERHLRELSAPVEVTRDRLGIPTIRAANRRDLALATGFLHAQDRFFQMDLSRRRAAGELAEIVGGRALALDREIRIHRFRAEAKRAVDLLGPEDRAVLDAYTDGVNAGLASLDSPPFEYLLLRQQPQTWRDEDTLLVVLSMFITLQDSDGSYEATLATMHDLLPQAMFEFLAPRGTEWDTPLVGAAFPTPSIPGHDVYNARTRRAGKPPVTAPKRPEVVQRQFPNSTSQLPNVPADISGLTSGLVSWGLAVDTDRDRDAIAIGSNNWAIAGRLTTDGGALLANDMHLSVRVPNTWYRAAYEWPDTQHAAEPHRLYGVTLPGVPAMVVGSNTHVAWGFTNTYGDWSDIVLVERDPTDPNRYLTPDGPRPFEHYKETINIAGQPSQTDDIVWTMWGPLLGPDHKGRLRAFSWVAQSAERLATSMTIVESAHTIEEAFDVVNGLGTPAQNFVVADRSGRIGWSIFGSIPRRVGFDGQLPTSWADGSRGWKGWLDKHEYPRLIDPPQGRIWTANARVVDGEMLARIGDGSYEVGSRARIIRDRLMSQDRFSPRDLLDIQLETRAQFLQRWRELMLKTLTPAAIAGHSQRAALRQILERGWSGRAMPDSAAYRFTRAFRDRMSEWVFTFVLADCYEADEHFDYTTVRRREGPLWKMVSEQPQHLLDPRFATWDAMLLAGIDGVIEDATRTGAGDLSQHVWAEYNVVRYRHPLSAAVPLIGRWLDMPSYAVPGDLYTPRVAWGSVAASERMVVSPGREAEGIMEMPTGQSGHPLSPHYGDSHDAWIKGEATPFLPGPTVSRLRLLP
jgi:penicillin amidase